MKFYRVVFTLLLLLIPAIALASQPQGAPAPQPILLPILQLLLGSAVVILGPIIRNLLKRAVDRVDAERKLIKDSHIDLVADRIAGAIEEYGNDMIEREGPEILKGEERLIEGASQLMAKVPGLTAAEARVIIRNAARRIGAGATAKVQARAEAEAAKALARNP